MSLEGGLRGLKSQARSNGSLFFLLPMDPHINLLATPPVPYLPVCLYAFYRDNNGLRL